MLKLQFKVTIIYIILSLYMVTLFVVSKPLGNLTLSFYLYSLFITLSFFPFETRINVINLHHNSIYQAQHIPIFYFSTNLLTENNTIEIFSSILKTSSQT